MSGDVTELDALVVGAGPVGLTMALLLERLGLRVQVIERRDGPQRAPAAHVINARTFEVWRQLGLDVDALRTLAQDPADAGRVRWVTRLGGEEIASLAFERQGDEQLEVTPTPLRNLSQHRLEPVLVAELSGRGVPVEYGHTWVDGERSASGVRSRIEHPGGSREVHSRWLIACDGASSPVRRWTGIQPEGPHRVQSFVMVHVAADLRDLVGDRPGVLFWICDPRAGGTMVAHDIDREWVYMLPFDPEQEDAATYTQARCEALVREALEDPTHPLEVLDVATWVMTAQVAERYRDHDVFLVGDSAHRFPPTGGLGLNTGVADAHNLAWKLAAVHASAASDELLDTYEAERRPVAQRNARASLANAMRLIEVPLALGLDADVEASLANMASALADLERRRQVVAAIEHQATHFDMPGLQLGYVYGEPGDGLDDGDDDEVRTYRPTSRPGARLPHGWLRRDGATVSSLDLVPLDRSIRIGGPAADPEAVDVRLGDDVDDPHGWWAGVLGLPDDAWILVRPDQHIASVHDLPSRRIDPCSDS